MRFGKQILVEKTQEMGEFVFVAVVWSRGEKQQIVALARELGGVMPDFHRWLWAVLPVNKMKVADADASRDSNLTTLAESTTVNWSKSHGSDPVPKLQFPDQ